MENQGVKGEWSLEVLEEGHEGGEVITLQRKNSQNDEKESKQLQSWNGKK